MFYDILLLPTKNEMTEKNFWNSMVAITVDFITKVI